MAKTKTNKHKRKMNETQQQIQITIEKKLNVLSDILETRKHLTHEMLLNFNFENEQQIRNEVKLLETFL